MIGRIWKHTAIYLLLIVGSIIFSFPFVWMASTSVKVDRELFTQDIQLKPLSPSAAVHSPYVDTTYYSDLPGSIERQQAIVPALAKFARDSGHALPEGLDADVAWQQVGRGLYLKLSKVLPASTWSGPEQAVIAAAKDVATPEVMQEIIDNIDRRLSIGSIHVRSQQLEEVDLSAGTAPSGQWTNSTPGVARFADRSEGRRQYADVTYDFSNGKSIQLARQFTLPFDVKDLQRIQIQVRPDDSWHEVALTLEAMGRRWQQRRIVPLANYEWQTITWQWPSEDDTSTKIKTWILLDDAGSQTDVTDPHQMRLTLSINQVSSAQAWANKLRMNYDRVLDYIPFWRYLRVSLFLVIANILLTVAASSLVAYAFARLNWPGRDFCFALMLATMMIPGQVTMIPHFLIWKSVSAYDTLTPLWLGSAFGSAFFIFLLRQFMKGIPRDLEDAARIDGCGFFRIYWYVILPLIKPSLAAIAIFTFMGTWNDFMGPLLYVADQRLYSLAFGLYAFSVQVGNSPTLTMAGSLLMTVPVIVIFFFAQKYFIQGVTLTGMKG